MSDTFDLNLDAVLSSSLALLFVSTDATNGDIANTISTGAQEMISEIRAGNDNPDPDVYPLSWEVLEAVRGESQAAIYAIQGFADQAVERAQGLGWDELACNEYGEAAE